jgi:hypothetical protein
MKKIAIVLMVSLALFYGCETRDASTVKAVMSTIDKGSTDCSTDAAFIRQMVDDRDKGVPIEIPNKAISDNTQLKHRPLESLEEETTLYNIEKEERDAMHAAVADIYSKRDMTADQAISELKCKTH